MDMIMFSKAPDWCYIPFWYPWEALQFLKSIFFGFSTKAGAEEPFGNRAGLFYSKKILGHCPNSELALKPYLEQGNLRYDNIMLSFHYRAQFERGHF